MKKLFIAAAIMVAALSASAKGDSFIFTHSPQNVLNKYGAERTWNMIDDYFQSIPDKQDQYDLTELIIMNAESIVLGHNYDLMIKILQNFNDTHPNAFNNDINDMYDNADNDVMEEIELY